MENVSELALDVKNVAAGYGRHRVVENCNVQVNKGEVVCIIGPNGAGKSTLMKAILGHSKVFDGSITAGGNDITHLPPSKRVLSGIGYVPQGRQVFPTLSVRDNLKMGCYSIRDRKVVDERIDEVFGQFKKLGECANTRAGLLSGGEQQMLAIGRALVTHPAVVLLDEPTLGLAPAMVDHVIEQLEILKEHGLTILMVEQNAWIALTMSDRGYIVDRGTTSEGGSSKDLRASGQIQKRYLGLGETLEEAEEAVDEVVEM